MPADARPGGDLIANEAGNLGGYRPAGVQRIGTAERTLSLRCTGAIGDSTLRQGTRSALARVPPVAGPPTCNIVSAAKSALAARMIAIALMPSAPGLRGD